MNIIYLAVAVVAFVAGRFSMRASSEEKRRRVYYQDIVYNVASQLDPFFPFRKPIQVGTIEHPSDELQKALQVLLLELKNLRFRDGRAR